MSFLDYNRKRTKRRIMNGEHVRWVEHKTKRNYIRQCVLSFPFWIKDKDLKPFFDEAKMLTAETGVKHSVDHIIPINHELVSGLSVPANLQVIKSKYNFAKGNKFNPYQTDIFEDTW